ncbi:uncharacterized protein LOC114880221 isoform X2 [Osmia bicornis bicornis]|uniref:uncharacterized protein LOC114880221 isoform X2 n=1 Tax=Osmia bicornis bicornis TaxID=1437191 RepID=UPI001EAF6DA6|nr:uncharacterized protein LOC114880221 isoform X2 [Osmia bicornis bicornis]
MVESTDICVLQWAGHARYITEKFSELLARQALVDVTLICEEQKLRVHKLVLASNSTYFEEILQQDLGQEPIIFLKDLNFEILKAMVEFMYCGETTVPYRLLSSLLTATKTFKVKELTNVVNAMMTSHVENFEANIHMDKKVIESKIIRNKYNGSDYVHVKCNELEKDECFLVSNESNSDVNLSENSPLENNAVTDPPEEELEHMLYEESQDFETNADQSNKLFSMTGSKLEENKNSTLSVNCKSKEVLNGYSDDRMINSNTLCTNDALKPILYEQCCDLSDIDDCEENSMSLSQSCLQQIEKDFAQYKFEATDVPSKIGKCVKVYTHKRRKSIDEIKTKFTDVNNIIQSPSSTDCIDLLDEPSTNDIPVTLLTSLDMESAEYIISLNTENIQSIVGATLTEQHTLNTGKKIGQIIEYNSQKDSTNKKDVNLENTENSICTKPILRRSLRLNQQETEESTSNNETVKDSNGREKQVKKTSTSNGTELCMKKKRKVKETDRKVPEQTGNNLIQSAKKPFNSRKNTTKLIVKKSNKSACTISNKEKDQQTVKIPNRLKCDISEATEVNSIFTLPKLNTIEHINRALWGDMSDVSDDSENRMNSLEFTPNTEIPFAVGLLPLRTALEKMQATPDYQPRKTRSSVAPLRQDSFLKRKNFTHFGKPTDSKKQNVCTNEPKENAKTVYHIQIRTAPSQYIRNRKKYIAACVETIQPSAIMNK